MMLNEIREELFRLQDPEYRQLQLRILPTKAPETVIGVRTSELRGLAKRLAARKDAGEFLEALPHRYFEEDQLHAFVLSGMKDFGRCVELVRRFLPFVDNWATCDQMSPKVFGKHRKELLPHIAEWIGSNQTYAIRFGIGMLMEHFLEEDFDPVYPETVAGIRSGEYYVNMMIAWYFATALAKQYREVLPLIEERRLDPWTHNKAIQKSVESYRIPHEHKAYLKTLRIARAKG